MSTKEKILEYLQENSVHEFADGECDDALEIMRKFEGEISEFDYQLVARVMNDSELTGELKRYIKKETSGDPRFN